MPEIQLQEVALASEGALRATRCAVGWKNSLLARLRECLIEIEGAQGMQGLLAEIPLRSRRSIFGMRNVCEREMV